MYSASSLRAQQVIASSGGSGTASGVMVDWTLGEPVIETFQVSGIILTQGMHQPRLVVTSVPDLSDPGLDCRVYPNPTGRFLSIDFSGAMKMALQYELIDPSGRMVMQKEISSDGEEIDMAAFTPGIYMLRIASPSGDHGRIFKIVKY